MSSEFFAHADDAAIRRVIGDLDPARVQVAVTLRPLARIIPSMWQQNVQAGHHRSMERWLRGLFPDPPDTPNAAFWALHRHDELIGRWASAVGTANVTAIVVDDNDHAFILRAFEQLLGLRRDTLVLERDLTNRSLTLAETEAVRAFNGAFRTAGQSRALHARAMRYGAAQHMKLREPGATEPAIELPSWALERIAEAGREIADGIAASGIRVVGDLGSLATTAELPAAAAPPVAASSPVAAPPVAASPPEVAATMSMGILLSSGRARRDDSSSGRETDPARGVPTYLVAGAIVTRAQAALVSDSRATRLYGTRVLMAGRRVLAERGDSGRRYRRAHPRETLTRERMEPTADRDALVLPEGTRLIHIGPPKTGTTALQGAFHAARAAAEAQGVHYAGRHRHSMSAIQAVLGRTGFFTAAGPPPIKHWHNLAREIRRSSAKRVVLSSEFFADATPESIHTVVDDLGPEQVHVVVTLRPLARILPSQWQQYVQSNLRVSFDDWLDAMLNQEQKKITPSFWHRHRHDRLIARWADVVGRDRVTVVALDDNDHDFVLRAFERLTGLAAGTLIPVPDTANRSLTMPEAEAVRAFNIAFRNEGLGRPLHARIMNFGAARYMRRLEPPADEMRVEPPQWALDKAGVVAREMVDAIAASGVRVVGDLEPLAAVPKSRLTGDRQPPIAIPPAVAASMAMGVLYASGLATEKNAGDGDRRNAWKRSPAVPIRGEPVELVRVPTSRPVRTARASGPELRAAATAGRHVAAGLISAGWRAARRGPRGSGARPRGRRSWSCR